MPKVLTFIPRTKTAGSSKTLVTTYSAISKKPSTFQVLRVPQMSKYGLYRTYAITDYLS